MPSSVLPAPAVPMPLYQPLPPSIVSSSPPTPLPKPLPTQTAKPKPSERIGHGADDAPKLSKILSLELGASGLALGTLALSSKLHPHPDIARATREKIFTYFDKAPQVIKLWGWNVFGGASTTEQSTKLMQYTINLIQIGTAIAFHQHVWERIGVVGGQMGLYHLVSGMIYKDGVMTKALFNPMLAVKHLATERLDLPPGWLPDKAKHWWNTAVQVPLQRNFGLDADPLGLVLRPINEEFTHKSWVSFNRTDFETLQKHQNQVLHLGDLKDALELVYASARKDDLTRLQTTLTEPEVVQKALDETRNVVGKFIESEERFFGLTEKLKPTKTKPSAERIIKQYFVDVKQDAPEAKRRLALNLKDLYKLYDVVPMLQPQPLQQWLETHISAPTATEKTALSAMATYLEEANTQFKQGTQPIKEQAIGIAQKAMSELLNNRHTLRSEAAHQSAMHHKFEALIKVYGQPHAPKVGGELGNLFDPYFKLSERSRLTTQFSNKVSNLTWVQIGTFTAIQCVFLANVLMTLVYHTVAKLDPDFDPNEFKAKDIAKKRVSPQPRAAVAPAGGNA